MVLVTAKNLMHHAGNSKQIDAIVVGSGATGGLAALTLAEGGMSVLVIEAGPSHTEKVAYGSEPLNSINRIIGITSGEKQKQSQHPGYWKANPNLYINEKDYPYTCPKNKPFLWTQGRQVGGRSLTWGGITLRLSNDEFKAADKDGFGPKWPLTYEELEPHYSKIEKLLNVHGKSDGLENLPDGEYLEPFPLTSSEESFAKEVNRKLRLQVINSRGFGPHNRSENKSWSSSSSNGSTLKQAISTGNVELMSEHIVERIVMNKNRSHAKGLVVVSHNSGKRFTIYSNLIILCASTIQTNRILLNSQESYIHNGFIERSGKLGKYLMDHVSICRFFSYPKSTNISKKYKSTVKHELSGAGSFFIPIGSRFQIKQNLDFIRGYGIWGAIDRFEPPNLLKRKPNTSTGFLIAHGEVLARKENKVSLSNKKDRLGIAIPHIEFEWSKNERNMVDHMDKTISMIVQEAGGEISKLKNLFKMPLIEPLLENAVALQSEAPPPGYYIHEVGGAPMGTDPKNSVVSPWNELWECPNVLVVDGACWPTSGWQSPTLTMLAITRRACLKALTNLPLKKDH